MKPHKIIFLSVKSRQSFHRVRWSEPMENQSVGKELEKIIDAVPHPSGAWWYRKAKRYDDKTGRQKLIEILQS